MSLWNRLCEKYDYPYSEPAKDLIVYIPTRSNSEGLSRTLSMMYKTCDSISNFDVLVIVDEDQVEMYKEVKDRYTDGSSSDLAGFRTAVRQELVDNIIWSYSRHDVNDWWNIFNIRDGFLKVNNYYFDALWTDDFVGLSPNWDKDIVSKKHYFKDDIFTLYQSKDGGGHQRSLKRYKECYITEGGHLQHDHIWRWAESLPITTRRLSLMINEVIKPNYLTSQTEMLIAAVIMILYTEHGHNRLVNGGFSWNKFISQGRSDGVGLDGFKDKKSNFDNWTLNENYSVIRPIVEEMNRIILGANNE